MDNLVHKSIQFFNKHNLLNTSQYIHYISLFSYQKIASSLSISFEIFLTFFKILKQKDAQNKTLGIYIQLYRWDIYIQLYNKVLVTIVSIFKIFKNSVKNNLLK